MIGIFWRRDRPILIWNFKSLQNFHHSLKNKRKNNFKLKIIIVDHLLITNSGFVWPERLKLIRSSFISPKDVWVKQIMGKKKKTTVLMLKLKWYLARISQKEILLGNFRFYCISKNIMFGHISNSCVS